MDWVTMLTGAGLAIGGAVGGALIASKLRGKPPAPKATWEDDYQRQLERVRAKENGLDTPAPDSPPLLIDPKNPPRP